MMTIPTPHWNGQAIASISPMRCVHEPEKARLACSGETVTQVVQITTEATRTAAAIPRLNPNTSGWLAPCPPSPSAPEPRS